MANGDIRQKIVLEGEREYSSALKEAQRHLKVLRSELKAESAELKNNGTEQEKNAARVKNLKQQIQEQEKIVETYRKALDEVREKYGDNEEAIARWEIKLNDARTALANMQNELQNTGKGFDTVGASAESGVSAAHDFADSLQKIADVGDSISSSIEGAFMGIVGSIQSAISALWSQLSEAAARANSWTDLGAMFGTSASEIQQWYHAARAGGKDFNSLVSMGNKILTGDAHKIAEATGIDITGYTNQWEAFYHVMRELSEMDQPHQIEALQHMGINGPKEAGWLDMLNAWADITGNLGTYDAENGGLGMSAEDLENMNQLSLSAAALQESWQAFKDSWVAGLAPLAMTITGNFQSIIEAMNEYMHAESPEERDAAIAKIRTNIEEIFAAVREAFEHGIGLLGELAANLKESDDPMARALGEMLDKLVGALEWFANPENWQAVETGFKAIIGVWAGAKVMRAIGNIGSFAANIGTIMAAKGLSTAAAGGASTGAVSSGLGTGFAALSAKIGAGASAAAPVLVPLGVLAAGIMPAAFAQKENEREWVEAQERAEARIAEIEENSGASEWTEFASKATASLGPDRDANGNYEHDLTGIFLSNQRGGTGLNFENLMDLHGYDAVQLQAMLAGRTAAGYDAWNLLQRAWEYQDLDPYMETELLQTIRDAALDWSEGQGGWADKMMEGQDFATQTNQELKKSADDLSKVDYEGAVERGARNGLSGVQVYMDSEIVGRLVTPTVSEYLARDLVE